MAATRKVLVIYSPNPTSMQPLIHEDIVRSSSKAAFSILAHMKSLTQIVRRFPSLVISFLVIAGEGDGVVCILERFSNRKPPEGNVVRRQMLANFPAIRNRAEVVGLPAALVADAHVLRPSDSVRHFLPPSVHRESIALRHTFVKRYF